MRLTQKELEIVKNFVKGVDLIFPYQKEVVDYVQNYKNFLPSRGGKRFRMSGILKGELEIIKSFNSQISKVPQAEENESIYSSEELEEL